MLPSVVLEFVPAGLVLVGTVLLGLLAHELTHVLALRAAGIPCRMEVLPGRSESGQFGACLRGTVATVVPTRLPADVSPWTLRAAAMMPLCLATPLVLVLGGVVPDPFAVGDLSLELAAIAWLGCSVPSPQDFSLLWYPEATVAAHRATPAVEG